MQPLHELQSQIRNAIVSGESGSLGSVLLGGNDPLDRLAIHRRHYHASLAEALRTKFPATEWLVGSRFFGGAIAKYVVAEPPRAPCIAEYGITFPAFVADCEGAKHLPYVEDFSKLEWAVGQVAIAVERQALSLAQLKDCDPDRLLDSTVTMQPGLRYLASSWPVDDLLKIYLSDDRPDRYELVPVNVHLEIRGARGSFGFNRLDTADFAFRAHLCSGHCIESAANRAMECNTAFDPGKALAQLFGAGLAIETRQ